MINKDVNNELECYKELAHAIVKQAADDYLDAKKKLYFGDHSNIHKIHALKNFFRSDWYKTLCSIDGEWFLRALDEEYVKRKANNFVDT